MKPSIAGCHQNSKVQQLLSRLALDPSKWKDWNLFNPLVTPHFDFDELRLFTYGDAIIQREVYHSIQTHCLQNGLPDVSPTIVKACGATFHNPYNLRRIAEENDLLDLRNNIPDVATMLPADGNMDTSAAEAMFYERKKVPALSAEDVRGTSFQFMPHFFCQDRLGLRLSHLIAAVEIDQGESKASEITRKLFRLDKPDPFKTGLESLSSTIQHFRRTGCITLALLASMGIQPLWNVDIDNSDGITQTDHKANAESNTNGEPKTDSPTSDAIRSQSPSSFPLVRGGSQHALKSNDSAKRVDVQSFLSALTSHKEPVHRITADIQQHNRRFTDLLESSNDPFTKEYFDASKRKFPKSSEPQHSFFEVDRDVEKGVRFDTNGMDAKSFIESYRKPKSRVFTVTLKSHSTRDVMAIAKASSFITARTLALEKVLLLIGQDLHNVAFETEKDVDVGDDWKLPV